MLPAAYQPSTCKHLNPPPNGKPFTRKLYPPKPLCPQALYVHGWYEEERKAAVAFEALGAVGKLGV